ncbi:hypothetical protein [Streptomyces sp. NPDC059874]|uniref:hypothetical protein n=1 Tax=Streptomyces sp. NPDC059874 TaxID=3346983 RepID=UPI003664663F
MTLLVLAESGDETAVRFARFASDRGVETVVAGGFDRLTVTVEVSRDLRPRSTILVDGRPPAGIFCRGRLHSSPPLTSAARFAAGEQQAAVWAAVALWPGPVINRPTVHGYPPRLDPLELAASTPGIRPTGTIVNGQDAPGNHTYRISDYTQLDPATRASYDVVHITQIDERRTHRLLMAGTSTFDVSNPAHRLDLAHHAPRIALIRHWLHAKQTDFAIVTVGTSDRPDGALRLIEASPWANHHQFTSVEDAAHTALLTRLVR